MDVHDLLQSSLLGDAIRSSSHGVFVSEPGGRLLAVSEAACELLGYERGELLGMNAHDYAATSDEVLAHGYRRVDAGERISETARLRRHDGTIVEIDYWGSTTQVGGIDFILTITAPITSARVVA